MLHILQNILGFIGAILIFFGTYADKSEDIGHILTFDYETGKTSGERDEIIKENTKRKCLRILGLSFLSLSFLLGVIIDIARLKSF